VIPNMDTEQLDEFDSVQCFDCLFTHPAVVLALSEACDFYSVSPRYLTREVADSFRCVQPAVGEFLLDPTQLTASLESIVTEFDEVVEQFGQYLDTTMPVPGEYKRSLNVVLYSVWYRELAHHDDTPSVFRHICQSPRYSGPAVERIGERAASGVEQLSTFPDLDELQDGSLDDIARQFFGNGSGTAGRTEQIRKLAAGEYT